MSQTLPVHSCVAGLWSSCCASGMRCAGSEESTLGWTEMVCKAASSAALTKTETVARPGITNGGWTEI